jgi:hypothetical protein
MTFAIILVVAGVGVLSQVAADLINSITTVAGFQE